MPALTFSGVQGLECFNCGRPKALLRCSLCKKVAFCSYECRLRGLPHHQPECSLAPRKVGATDLSPPRPPPPTRRAAPGIPEKPKRQATHPVDCSRRTSRGGDFYSSPARPVAAAYGQRRSSRRRASSQADCDRTTLQSRSGDPCHRDRGEAHECHDPALCLDEAVSCSDYELIESELLCMRNALEEAPSWVGSAEDLVTMQEMLWRRLESLDLKEPDSPGPYYVCEASAVVTAGLLPHSPKLAELTFGTSFRVLELMHSSEDDRLRARIDSPAGWVLLASSAEQRRVAERIPSAGHYYVVQEGTAVSEAFSLESQEVVARLAFGSFLCVQEVVYCPVQKLVRGRIDRPCGWISLLDIESGDYCAVRRPDVDGDEGMRPPPANDGITCDQCHRRLVVGTGREQKWSKDSDLCASCSARVPGTGAWLHASPGRLAIRNRCDLALTIFLYAWSLRLLRDCMIMAGFTENSSCAQLTRRCLMQVHDKEALDEDRRAMACGMLGHELLEAGDLSAAEPIFDRVIATRPTSSAHTGKGMALIGLGEQESDRSKKLDMLRAAQDSLLTAIDLDCRNVKAYVEVNKLLEDLGEAKEARRIARSYIEQTGDAFWQLDVQRPAYFVPDLLATPWHCALCTDAATHLGGGLESVRAELLDFMEDTRTVWHRHPHSALFGDTMEVKVLMGLLPGWVQVVAEDAQELAEVEALLLNTPNPADDGRAECPRTTALLQGELTIEMAAELGIGCALVCRLAPGASLLPRCGSSNARLTCIAALSEPADGGCCVTVGDEPARRVSLDDGVLVFDDSFEHSFSNTSELEACSFLLVHFWHPEVPMEDWEEHSRLLVPRHRLQGAEGRPLDEVGGGGMREGVESEQQDTSDLLGLDS